MKELYINRDELKCFENPSSQICNALSAFEINTNSTPYIMNISGDGLYNGNVVLLFVKGEKIFVFRFDIDNFPVYQPKCKAYNLSIYQKADIQKIIIDEKNKEITITIKFKETDDIILIEESSSKESKKNLLSFINTNLL